MGVRNEKTFVDVPGWLYHYEPYGVDVFIHHKVVPNRGKIGYHLEKAWRVSDPSTGMSLFGFLHANTRMQAVDYLHGKLSDVTLARYNKAVLEKLAESPPHKPSWRITSLGNFAWEIISTEARHD